VWNRGYLHGHHLHTKFNPNPPIGSNVIKVFLYTHLRSLNVRHFGMAEATRLKCDVEVALNGITCLPNLTKMHPSVQKLLVVDPQTHSHTQRQPGDLKSPLSYFESRLKMVVKFIIQCWNEYLYYGFKYLSESYILSLKEN
jgi:hypothetical protein